VQVDVVAINHQTRDILLGECKWGEDAVNRQVVRELIEQKGAKVRTVSSDLVIGGRWVKEKCRQFIPLAAKQQGWEKLAAIQILLRLFCIVGNNRHNSG